MGIPKRKPTRLKNYNYSTSGYYFVTICAKNKEKIFGNIVGVRVSGGHLYEVKAPTEAAAETRRPRRPENKTIKCWKNSRQIYIIN